MNKIVLTSALSLTFIFPQPGDAKITTGNKIIKPNIIFILADDLGYGDLGCYGQKLIETPNIDKLAAEGMRFTQHYSGAPVCAPSRCSLLTGKHTGHSYIRGNDEWAERGKVRDYRAMLADSTLEGQRPLPENEITFPELLKTVGYTNGIVGKWGLGAPQTNSTPLHKGFDFFYGYNCQRQAHTYYPVHLYKNDRRVYLNNDTISPDTPLEKGADPYDLKSYTKFTLNEYACDPMFQELTEFVNQNKNHPFFMYWATTIPHLPIQAPQRWVDYYVKKFGDEKPYIGDQGYFPHRYPHAGYAAMISYLDEQVGLLITQLKSLGLYDNTLIIFTSDNGPTYTGGADSPWFRSAGPFKNEFGWGKGFTHEGGIRVPMIASWPGKIKKGAVSNHISAFWDVLPTFCELTGIQIPAQMDGISFLPELLGEKQNAHPYLYWEFPETDGQQAVRLGKWKGIRQDIKMGNLNLQLFNLETDIQELHDVSTKYPEIVRQMEEIMIKEHVPATQEIFKMKTLGD